MRVPFVLLDVFAEEPFAGNQLCVVPETPEGVDTALMQTLTREIGFSETTFVTAVRPDGYDVRIFTPETELPFAGHPTIGTAFTLATQGRIGEDVVQRCGAGEVPVRIDLAAGRATMWQLPPEFGPEYGDRGAVAEAAGLTVEELAEGPPIVPVSTGIPHLMVPVRDERALRRAVRDERGCERVCRDAGDIESLYLFTVRGNADVMARMFDRFPTIGEDPATGSAAGPLGAYLSVHGLAGMPGVCTIAQGELTGRPSFLHVEVDHRGDDWTIEVGGGVRVAGDGAFIVLA